MTNHPHRQHDEDEPTAEEMHAGAVEPLAGEMRSKLGMPEPGAVAPQGSAEVPAHTSNGVPPGLKPNVAKQIGEAAGSAMARALGNLLPKMLFDAFAAVLTQVPVQAVTQQDLCATCLTRRIAWENLHHADMEKALEAAAQAAGVDPGSPQAARLELAVFLPPDLRPGERNGMPNVAQASTTVSGTRVCPVDIPGVQAGRSPLLIANAAMSPAMLARFAGAR